MAVPDPRLPLPGCSFGQAIQRYFQGYVRFTGRASRSEFWYAALFGMLMGMIPFVNFIWGLVAILPSIAVAVRRLHDANMSGWWYAGYWVASLVDGILLMVGLLGVLAAVGADYPTPVPGWAWTCTILSSIAGVALMVAYIVIMCRPSDPAGQRFDR
ncbi:DUF805 domain-containing protein [Bifidobacterium felsineum]|uniref:DUF805 domain-containing protein n=1 Tax=Bifidobacterium felsineum TaxID=2045440 RepID=UPI001BDD6518|nr:DUF805 domain-containing protein [Bifidobacterium felsineum]MBT1164669.1 DUF805 domain-containing protein [Bifidobacterium felsineum]